MTSPLTVDGLDYLSSANISQYFLFFIPGFIAMQIGALLVPVADNDFSKRLPVAIGYSALNFALMSIVLGIVVYVSRNQPPAWLVYGFIFVVPALYPFAFNLVRRHQLFGITTPFPTAWDEFFSRRKQYWVRVHFKNGKILTGWFGQPDSAASQYPEEQQIFMSEVWIENAVGQMEKAPNTAGIIVSMSEVSYLEFLIT